MKLKIRSGEGSHRGYGGGTAVVSVGLQKIKDINS